MIGKEGTTLSSELSAPWVAEAEQILRRLRDIVAATITTEGDEIREVHIVAASTRTPKQIVRDVETALNAFLRRGIDHRKISVALQDPLPAAPAPVAQRGHSNGATSNGAGAPAPAGERTSDS